MKVRTLRVGAMSLHNFNYGNLYPVFNSFIRIHFLNVGHGDCILIQYPNNKVTLVDVNKNPFFTFDTLTELLSTSYYSYKQTVDPILYLSSLGITRVDRLIITHPHLDHINGLYELCNRFWINEIWIPLWWQMFDYSKCNQNQILDLYAFNLLRQNCNRMFYPCWIRSKEKDVLNCSFLNDNIRVLCPNLNIINKANETNSPNLISYVLSVNHGLSKIILGGDAENESWNHIVENYKDEIANATILKASHHGRDSGYHQEAVKTINPFVTVVSVGKKPETDASNKYRQYSNYVFSTVWQGSMVFDCYEDGTVIMLN